MEHIFLLLKYEIDGIFEKENFLVLTIGIIFNIQFIGGIY